MVIGVKNIFLVLVSLTVFVAHTMSAMKSSVSQIKKDIQVLLCDICDKSVDENFCRLHGMPVHRQCYEYITLAESFLRRAIVVAYPNIFDGYSRRKISKHAKIKEAFCNKKRREIKQNSNGCSLMEYDTVHGKGALKKIFDETAYELIAKTIVRVDSNGNDQKQQLPQKVLCPSCTITYPKS